MGTCGSTMEVSKEEIVDVTNPPGPVDKFVLSADASSYLTYSRCLALLRSGAVALVKGSHLVQRAQAGLPIQYRQQLEGLEVSPFVSVDDFAADTDEGKSSQELFGVELLVVSYPWLSKEHPDPHMWHLNKVVEHINSIGYGGENADRVYVFWDFMSLYQNPRTPEQNAKFREALGCMEVWYGMSKTNIFVSAGLPQVCANPLGYNERGWCTFERMVYNLTCKQHKVKTASGAEDVRILPVCPEEFRALLKTKTFTNNSDSDTVAKLYAHVFGQVGSVLSFMDFSGLVTDDNAHSLEKFLDAISIPEYNSAQLKLEDCPLLTDIGASRIIKALVRNVSRIKKRDPTAMGIGDMYLRGTPVFAHSCLLALAFIPRDTTGPVALLARTRKLWTDKSNQLAYMHIASANQAADAVAALRFVLGDAIDISVEGEKSLSVNDKSAKKSDGLIYVGGADKDGRRLGFGQLWTSAGERQSTGFWMNDRLLDAESMSVEQVNDLERALLADLAARGAITQQQRDNLFA